MLLCWRSPRNQTEVRNHSFSRVLSHVTRYDFIHLFKTILCSEIDIFTGRGKITAYYLNGHLFSLCSNHLS